MESNPHLTTTPVNLPLFHPLESFRMISLLRSNKENVLNIKCQSTAPQHRRQRAVSPNDKPSLAAKAAVAANRIRQSSPRVALPKRLPRPAVSSTVIDPAVIAVMSPELATVPIQYARDTLAKAGSRLLNATLSTKPRISTMALPSHIDVDVACEDSDLPTHVFAVYPSGRTLVHKQVTLYPVHDLVFAVNTTRVNNLSLPPSSSSATLPVVPLALPSPATFPLLRSYLYTKRVDLLFSGLLPINTMPGAAPGSTRVDRRMASTFTTPALVEQAHAVHGLWSNGIALGVVDDKFWATLEAIWGTILSALAQQTNQPL